MFKKIKAYIQSKRQRKWQIDGMSKIVLETIDDAYRHMQNKSLKMYSIKGYIRHLPIIGIEESYPRDIYRKTTQCLIALWQYSVDMGFTGKDKPFLSFLGDDIGLRNVENWGKASKKLQSLMKTTSLNP